MDSLSERESKEGQEIRVLLDNFEKTLKKAKETSTLTLPIILLPTEKDLKSLKNLVEKMLSLHDFYRGFKAGVEATEKTRLKSKSKDSLMNMFEPLSERQD